MGCWEMMSRWGGFINGEGRVEEWGILSMCVCVGGVLIGTECITNITPFCLSVCLSVCLNDYNPSAPRESGKR